MPTFIFAQNIKLQYIAVTLSHSETTQQENDIMKSDGVMLADRPPVTKKRGGILGAYKREINHRATLVQLYEEHVDMSVSLQFGGAQHIMS